MNWTYVLAFGLGALWMLIVFVTASAMRTPGRNWGEEPQLQLPPSWSELQTDTITRYYD